MTLNAPRRLALILLTGLSLAACSRRQEAAAPADDRQLQVSPAKPEATPVEPAAPVVAVRPVKPASVDNAVETAKEEPVAPDEQVQEDAAASGMTSRTTTTATTTTTERSSSSMSNLY